METENVRSISHLPLLTPADCVFRKKTSEATAIRESSISHVECWGPNLKDAARS